MEITERTKELVQRHKEWKASLQPKEGGRVIEVDEVASQVAAFYEKIRGVVDWKEEHLLRKTAIGRILRRRLLLQPDGEGISGPLLEDLVRGGHLPNNQVPLSLIQITQEIIDKYLYILNNSSEKTPSEFRTKDKRTLEDWLLGIAASEIEETLSPPIRERALISYMTSEMADKIQLQGGQLSSEEMDNQIFAAVQKALFKLDAPTISHHLLERFYPKWQNLPRKTLISLAENIHAVRKSIENVLRHPISERLYRVAERQDTPYLILGDIISEDPNGFKDISENPKKTESAIEKAYNLRLLRLKERIKRAAVYSTLSILLSKVLIALVIEIPLDQYLLSGINVLAVALSILIPPLLMILLVATVKPTSVTNFQQVVFGVMKLIYKNEKKETIDIPLPKRKSPFFGTIVYTLYALSFIVSFGLLAWLLNFLYFSPTSIVIFLIFLSLVAFAGTIIRQRGRELLVLPEKEGILHGFLDIFFLPMIQVGKWLSGQLARYNILVVLFNFILEVPFQFFVEFFEQWRAFLKEKKEEIH
ncbi:MAG: hypothetical protein KJI69_00935 [Patescibacteria group bacterium]|nr:hypothetical protein [Patescibacteria group bacterium]